MIPESSDTKTNIFAALIPIDIGLFEMKVYDMSFCNKLKIAIIGLPVVIVPDPILYIEVQPIILGRFLLYEPSANR